MKKWCITSSSLVEFVCFYRTAKYCQLCSCPLDTSLHPSCIHGSKQPVGSSFSFELEILIDHHKPHEKHRATVALFPWSKQDKTRPSRQQKKRILFIYFLMSCYAFVRLATRTAQQGTFIPFAKRLSTQKPDLECGSIVRRPSISFDCTCRLWFK